MVITEKLIFLQLPKTGSTYVESILKKNFSSARPIRKHQRIPDGFDKHGRMTVISIRNPWDWYISMWASCCKGKGAPYQRMERGKLPWQLFRNMYNVRTQTVLFHKNIYQSALFKIGQQLIGELTRPTITWSKLHSDHDNPHLFREWLQLVLDPNRKFDVYPDYGFSTISSFSGLITYLYLYLSLDDISNLYLKSLVPNYKSLVELDQQKSKIDFVIRNESLQDDLIQALKQSGYDVRKEHLEEIKKPKRINASTHKRELSYYYDKETINLVKEKERFIIDKFAYTTPIL